MFQTQQFWYHGDRDKFLGLAKLRDFENNEENEFSEMTSNLKCLLLDMV